MFKVITQTLEQDRNIYQSNSRKVKKGIDIYVIKLDKVNDVDYYFTFSYLNRDKAEEIASKLWRDGRNFYQDCNRTDNPQLTLVSELE